VNNLTPVFEINYLVARYKENTTPVLICKNIKLEKGKTYFVIGKSGIGKSTFLEALGLMSNTLKDPLNDIIFWNGEEQYQLPDLWSTSAISNFRSQHYAFIFQNNNLMEHFTAGENMAFGLLQSGHTLDQAKTEILPIMDKLNLSREYFDFKINRLSGGEKQRMTFIRAITASHSIIFCDEPTGNLDPNSAEIVMSFLNNSVNASGNTAVVVSHDIYLASDKADEILIIKPSDSSKGYLDESHILIKRDNLWFNSENQIIENIIDSLKKSIA